MTKNPNGIAKTFLLVGTSESVCEHILTFRFDGERVAVGPRRSKHVGVVETTSFQVVVSAGDALTWSICSLYPNGRVSDGLGLDRGVVLADDLMNSDFTDDNGVNPLEIISGRTTLRFETTHAGALMWNVNLKSAAHTVYLIDDKS